MVYSVVSVIPQVHLILVALRGRAETLMLYLF